MNYPSPSSSLDVNISSFSKKGNGLGLVQTKSGTNASVEVPFSMPGDTVRAVIRKKRKGRISAQLEEILIPAASRIPPRCIHFAVCGGCRWQHIPYEEQLQIKQDIVYRSFAPFIDADTQLHPIIGSQPEWQYRNKMEFSFSSDAAQRKFLGLIMDSTRGKVLNLTECHLVNPWFVDTLKAARLWWEESGLSAYHPPSDKGSLRTLTLREGMRTGDRMVFLTVSGNPDFALQRKNLESFTAFVRDAAEPLSPDAQLSIFLRIQQAVKGQATNFYEMLLHGPDHIRETLHVTIEGVTKKLDFTISPSAFFQPNTFQAENLYSRALQLMAIPKNGIVYDLYCGTGTLGICAANHAKQVVGVEISPESSLDGRNNIAQNNLKNMTILTGSVMEILTKIRQEKTFPLPDAVMVDPPRVGLDSETLLHLKELRPRKLLYISCNPITQSENAEFLRECGYRITDIQPVDQFPHTYHIENIAVFSLIS